jgi:hypothetical protein
MNVESMHATCLNKYKYALATCHNVDILTSVLKFSESYHACYKQKVMDSIPNEVIGFFN